jgi:hypothetical protein
VELLVETVLPLPKSEHPSSTTQVFEQSVGQSKALPPPPPPPPLGARRSQHAVVAIPS